MKRCTVRLSGSIPEVSFEVNDGKTKNATAARAWQVVSEFVEMTAIQMTQPGQKEQRKVARNNQDKMTAQNHQGKFREWRETNQNTLKTLKQPNLQ